MATSNVSLNKILRNDVQLCLEGSESVLIKTIMDLSSKAEIGSDRMQIPRVAGLSLTNITPGSDGSGSSVGSGFTVSSDTLELNQSKQVADYVGWIDDHDSAVNIANQFFQYAPRVFAEGVEKIIADQLEVSGADDIATGTADFDIADIAAAKRVLDERKVPKTSRYLAVNAAGMEILAQFQEFQDGRMAISPEALLEGVVSKVKGFMVVQSEDVTDGNVLCYHHDAVAFALHAGMNTVDWADEPNAQRFLALRGKYGCKLLDNGTRKVLVTYTPA